MTPGKRRRAISAILFLFGVLAFLNALRDADMMWPPDAVWQALDNPSRFKLCGGVALMLASLIATAMRRRET
jgi:hypothetical protein